MSWIAEYDTQGREFPTCVHVTKTTGTMTHGATYVPIEDGKAVRAENTKLREDLEFERSENGWAREFLNRMGKKCGTKDCPSLVAYVTNLEAENAKLRELARGLRMAYVETLNECESLNEGLIWEYSCSIDDDIAKSKAKFEANRHRFDAALCELGVEVDE